MKKCPYCAEELQDEAVKCRFCGEWLNKSDKPTIIESATLGDSTEKKDNEAVTIEEVSGKEKKGPAGDVRNKEEVPVRRLLKEKFPWGWGWLILIVLYSMAFKEMKLRGSTDAVLGLQSALQGLGFVLLLLMYYWLRRKIFTKKQNWDMSRASFISGLISYVVITFIIGLSLALVQRFDNSAAMKRFRATTEEMNKVGTQWNREEARLWEQINLSPNTVQEKEDTLSILKSFLSITEQRKVFMDKLFTEWRFLYEGTNDVTLKNKMQEFEKITYEIFDKYRKGVEMYIDCFSTDNKEKEEAASSLLFEANSLSEKAATLSGQISK